MPIGESSWFLPKGLQSRVNFTWVISHPFRVSLMSQHLNSSFCISRVRHLSSLFSFHLLTIKNFRNRFLFENHHFGITMSTTTMTGAGGDPSPPPPPNNQKGGSGHQTEKTGPACPPRGACITCYQRGHSWKQCTRRCVHCDTSSHPHRTCPSKSTSWMKRYGGAPESRAQAVARARREGELSRDRAVQTADSAREPERAAATLARNDKRRSDFQQR